MDAREAATVLSALSLEARIEVYRLLIQAGPAGVTAGKIATSVGAKASTLSNNLRVLREAGLIQQARDGQSMVYAARYDRMRDLIAFLLEDCCGGEPAVCAPLTAMVPKRSASL